MKLLEFYMSRQVLGTDKTFWEKIKKNWRHKRWWKELYRDKIFVNVFLRPLRNKGFYVFDEEWDNLIILDACRYDIFKKVNDITGRLEYRISRASCSADFLIDNFIKQRGSQDLKNFVYISANPYEAQFLPNVFYKTYQTWMHGWDENLNTVPPQKVVDDVLTALLNHPGKKLIVHFIQPHSPFLDPKFPIKTTKDSMRDSMLGKKIDSAAPDDIQDIAAVQPWHLIELGKLSKEIVWKAYEENLRIVLTYVKKILPVLPGKTIITSDHGELAGEKVPHFFYPFKEYAHPCGFINMIELVKVPWLIVEQIKNHNI